MSLIIRKELLRVGEFPHPQAPNVTVKIDESRLKHIYEETKRYLEDGNKIPVPIGHIDEALWEFDPEYRKQMITSNVGWVKDIELGNTSGAWIIPAIFAEIEIVDSEIAKAIQEGKIQDVSVAISDRRTASGFYQDVIWHVSLTLKPYLPNLLPPVIVTDSIW